MHRARVAGLLTATALTMSALTACGSESEPDPSISTASPIDRGTDEPSSSTDPSSPSEGPDGRPVAQERSKKGAIAFTKQWFESAGDAIQGGDVAWVEEHSHKECAVCWTLIEDIKSDQADGLKANRDPISVEGVTARKRPDGGYRVVVHHEESRLHDGRLPRTGG